MSVLNSPRLWLLLALAAGLTWWMIQQREPPPSADAVFARAVTAIERRDITRFHHEWQAFRASVDETPPEQQLLLAGAGYLFQGKPEMALQQFSRISPDSELAVPLLTLTGEALYLTGETAAALRCLNQAVAHDADQVSAHRWLATVHYDLGTMPQALHHLQEVSRLDPNDPKPHHMRGVIYQQYGLSQEALQAFEAGLHVAEVGEMRSELLALAAEVQISMKQFTAALENLRTASESRDVFILKAECYWNLGELERAKTLLAEAEARGPLDVKGRMLQARIHVEENEPAAAIQILNQLIIEDPANDEAEYLLGSAYRLTGEVELQKQHIETAERLKSLKTELTTLSQTAMDEPYNAVIRRQMAQICVELGMHEMAEIWNHAADELNLLVEPDVQEHQHNQRSAQKK